MTTSTGVVAGGLDDRLQQAVDTAQRLHAILEDLITKPGSSRNGENRHATVSHSTPPWHAQAAYLIMDLTTLVRDVEIQVRMAIDGPHRPRGGSDHNTQLALRGIPDLAFGVDEETVRLQLRRLEAWCQRARETLGEVEPLHHLPRLMGEEEPRCPWCRRQSLRQQSQAGLVRCVNPSCRDEDGARPMARVEMGRYSAEPILVWQDQTVGLAAL